MPEYTPNDLEKTEVLKRHFYYEIQIIGDSTAMWYALNYPNNFSLGYVLQREIMPNNNKLLNNMCLEAVSLHTRGLLTFFTSSTRGRGGRDKDALAKDFLRDGESWDLVVIDDQYPNLKIVNERANKEIAHLSYERVPADILQTNWNLRGIISELCPLIELFISKCNDNYVSDELRQLVTNFRVFVDSLESARLQEIIP